jgi:S1-C subfamily serine protease
MVYLPTIVRISTPVNAISEAVGTGFCIDNPVTHDVIFLTNAHVVAPGSLHNIEVAWAPGKLIPVNVAAIVYDRDIALLQCPREVWDATMKEYLTGEELASISKIPTMNLGSDSMFEVHNTSVICQGHPLGLPTQQICTGITRGVIDMGVVQRTLISCAINHGNSGGPVLLNHTDGQQYVVGISTMKLAGTDVEGEGGFINIDTIKACLPHMMKELQPPKLDMTNPQVLQALSQIMGALPHQTVAALQHDHQEWLNTNWVVHNTEWENYAVGGKVRGVPRDFQSWVLRHVYDKHNGQHLLNFVLEKCIADAYGELAHINSEYSGWKSIRLGLEDHIEKTPEFKGFNIRLVKPPQVLHPPSLEDIANLQSVHNLDYEEYYACKNNEQGAIVNDVYPNSLYGLNGGQEGDLIYAFQKTAYENGVATQQPLTNLDKNGRFSKTGVLGARYSVATMCQNIPWHDGSESYTSVTLFALRKGGEKAAVTFNMSQPTSEELPAMQKIMPFNNESESGSANVMGYKLIQVHANHIEQMKLVEYMDVENQYNFRLICTEFTTGSVKIAPGATLISMNGVSNTEWKSWSDFKKHCDEFQTLVVANKEKGVPTTFTAVFGRSGGFKARVIKKVI